jgi:hypothetical protein
MQHLTHGTNENRSPLRRYGVSMADKEDELEERIRHKAYEIWLEEGQPHGRDKDHWELAKFVIGPAGGAGDDARPRNATSAWAIEALTNQGEFPARVDQGEGLVPGEPR